MYSPIPTQCSRFSQIAGMAGMEARRDPNFGCGWQVRAAKFLVAILAEVDCTRIRCQNERTVVSLESHAGIEQSNAVLRTVTQSPPTGRSFPRIRGRKSRRQSCRNLRQGFPPTIAMQERALISYSLEYIFSFMGRGGTMPQAIGLLEQQHQQDEETDWSADSGIDQRATVAAFSRNSRIA